MSKLFLVGSAGWIIGAFVIAASLVGISPNEMVTSVDSSAFASAADESAFTEEEALARMTDVAAQKTEQTLAVDHRRQGYELAATFVDGRPVTLDALQLVEFRFVPEATRVTTSASTFTTFAEPTDAWVAVWSRKDVPAPEWADALTTVRVVVVMEDGTGRVRSVHAGKVNQAPGDSLPSPTPVSTEAECTTDQRTGYEICVK